ncbi:hypothetical protein GGS26DRAFT_312864 [Hypomontagnella submonticulosa]|nr:hypothetical protein GGS26DRAFT_312864 [Hypomontagnella submonticulosa]
MATQASSSKDDSCVKIRVGETEHLIHTKKIPYFKSFLSFQQNSGQNTTSVPAHGDIPFFDVINYGVNNGFRQFFRRMPTQLSDYHVLCEQLEFLAVNVLEDRKLRDIMGDLRHGKSDWDPQERREVPSRKWLARDSAFRLLYTFLLADFESDTKDSSMAYQATLFVVSHRAIFKYRTRKMVREAFEERFVVTEKQLKGLCQWPINEPTSERWQDGDVTTEVEETYYDSDWSL